jgi:hypothetical protein
MHKKINLKEKEKRKSPFSEFAKETIPIWPSRWMFQQVKEIKGYLKKERFCAFFFLKFIKIHEFAKLFFRTQKMEYVFLFCFSFIRNEGKK